MTIKLLAAQGRAPANAIVTLDAATETALVGAKQATTDLTGGVAWTDPYAVGRKGLADVQMDRTTLQLQADGAPVSGAGVDHRSELTHRLAGDFGAHSFSRSGTAASGAGATVIDSYGAMRRCLLNEARFQRARRVRNWLTDSETFTTNWALGANTTKAQQLSMRSPNHGRPSVHKFERSSGSANMLTVASAPYQVGPFTWSAWFWGDGTTQVTLRIERSSDSAGTSQVITPPAGVWTLGYVTHSMLDTSNHRLIVNVAGSGAASFIMCDPLALDSLGHGLPGEYVPVGVPNFPAKLLADECGVDGVRYFFKVAPYTAAGGGLVTPVANPNAPLPIRPYLLVERMNATNRFYSSRDIGATAWNAGRVGATAASAMIDSTLLGPASLRKLEETTANSDHKNDQDWVGTLPNDNTPISVSCYAKAAERSVVYAYIIDKAGATKLAFFNLATQVISDVTASAQSTNEADMWLEGDVVRLAFTCLSGVGAGRPKGGFGVCVTPGAANTAYVGTAGSGAYFGAMQFERNDCATSYVGDTGSATVLTRDLDDFKLTTPNFPRINVSVECTIVPMFRTDIGTKLGWNYFVYAAGNVTPGQRETFGFGLRPGLFGGGSTPTYKGDWWIDIYDNRYTPEGGEQWDGLALQNSVIGRPLDVIHVQFGLASGAATGTSNLLGFIGGVPVPTSNEVGVLTTPGRITTLLRSEQVWYFGSDRGTSLPTGPFGIRDISWRAPALTLDEMAANA